MPRYKPQKIGAYIYQKTCTRICIALLFTIAPKWKQPKYPPTVVQVNKLWSIRTMAYFIVLQKNATVQCGCISQT